MHPWKVSLVVAFSLSTQLSSTLSLPVKHSLEYQQEHGHQHQLANSIVTHQHDRSEQDLHLNFWKHSQGVSDDPPQLEAPDYEKRLVKKLFSRVVRRSLKQWAAKKIVNKSLKIHVAKMKDNIRMLRHYEYERKGKAIMPSPPPKQKYYWLPEGMPNPNRPVIIGGPRNSRRGLDAADLDTDSIQVHPRGMESAFKKMLGKKIVDTALKVTGGIKKKQKEEELKRKQKKAIDSTSSPPSSPHSPGHPQSPSHAPSPGRPPAPGPESIVPPARPTFNDVEKLWNIKSSPWRSRRDVDVAADAR